MIRLLACFIGLSLTALIVLPGCFWRREQPYIPSDNELAYYREQALQIEYPDVQRAGDNAILATDAPLTLQNKMPTEFWDMKVEQAVQLALQNSAVLRDLGGLIMSSPQAITTVQDPAIVETDPRFGVDAALSAFDAQWSTTAFFEKNDRALNNRFFGGGTRELRQDLFDYTSELSKLTATGGELFARHNMVYDFNNAPGNDVPNKPWTTDLELEARQPILQGAGVNFNRIAGPGATPGVSNGVLVARVNTDIALADFEVGVRNLVFDVETAYWELYFAYRDLDSKIAARDRALETWRIVNSLGGRESADKEAHAREQYYRLEEDVQNALAGRQQERIRVTTIRGTTGVYEAERRLRLLVGVPMSDGRLIRPSEEPTMAKVVFNWDEVLSEALTRRAELRRQKWRIKRRELEESAARNFLLPRLDVVGRYRWRGLGVDLIDPQESARPPFGDAVSNLLTGDYQEWQAGLEFTFPIGFRQANAAVRNAQLLLSREYAILREQERAITLDLMNSLGEMDRALVSARLNYNRRLAAQEQLDALVAQAAGRDRRDETRLLDLILDAQRRLADSESRYFRSMAEYMLAIKQVHYNKGTLLAYDDVYLAEGPWPGKAYDDAAQRERLRMQPWRLTNFVIRKPPLVAQPMLPGEVEMMAEGDYNPNPSGFDFQAPVEVIQPDANGSQLYLESSARPGSYRSTPHHAIPQADDAVSPIRSAMDDAVKSIAPAGFDRPATESPPEPGIQLQNWLPFRQSAEFPESLIPESYTAPPPDAPIRTPAPRAVSSPVNSPEAYPDHNPNPSGFDHRPVTTGNSKVLRPRR